MKKKSFRQRFYKSLGCIISLMMCCLSLNVGQAAASDVDHEGAAKQASLTVDSQNQICEQWKHEAVQAPASGELVPAGPIRVEWKALGGLSWDVTSYNVYLDETFQQNIENKGEDTFSYEVYTTKTAEHQVIIEAVLESGKTITANIRPFFVSKKGFGIATESSVISQDMSGSWYYNWSPNPDSRVKEELTFVPMIWGDYAGGKTWLSNSENQKYGTVLGYNEPDRTDQSNMSAAAVAANQQLFTESGLRVGAPAVSTLSGWSDWFAEYAELVNWDEIDFIPMHCYPGWTDGKADDFLKGIDDTYAKYQKPIWITEFAIANWDWYYQGFNGENEENNEAVRQFMQEAVKGLEERDYVERYAWQQFDMGDWAGGSSCLYNQNTGELTELGTNYRNAGNPEGYVLPNLDGTENPQTVTDTYVKDEEIGLKPGESGNENQNPKPGESGNENQNSKPGEDENQNQNSKPGESENQNQNSKPGESENQNQNSKPGENGNAGTKPDSKPVRNIFVDVNAGDWFESYVQYVYDTGIMTGMDQSHFGPGIDIARAQFATILYRMEGSPKVTYKNVFPDVPDGQFYSEAVIWASSKEVGVITGYTGGSYAGYFGPGDRITREQIATMLYRYAKYKGYDLTIKTGVIDSFPDRGSVSPFAENAMKWAVSKGLIKGDNGNLNPSGNALRAECAAIIQRFEDYAAQKE